MPYEQKAINKTEVVSSLATKSPEKDNSVLSFALCEFQHNRSLILLFDCVLGEEGQRI